MRDKRDFFDILDGIGEGEEAAFQALVGDFDFSRYVVRINHVDVSQGAPATQFLVRVPQSVAVFPAHLFNTPVRRTALEDYLTRKVVERLDDQARYDRDGIARRRLIISRPGQKILPRSSIVVTEEIVEARMYVQLRSGKGVVSADEVRQVFFDDLAAVVSGALISCNLDESEMARFVDLMEDVDQTRQVLATRGWVGFVGENVQPERATSSDLPEPGGDTVTIADNLLEPMELTNSAAIRGLGIPVGITVVLGEEYSGRREFLRAIAHGIYNHVPGDGREWCVTVPDAVYVCAEPNRSVQHVDIGAFLAPGASRANPQQFSSASSDAFASEAAATVEALEAGARVLIFDESDSAGSFLSSDTRLPVNGTRSTIPLSARARQIVSELGVSLVVGGSSTVTEFLPIADTVLRISGNQVEDITAEAKAWPVEVLMADSDAAGLHELVEKSRWVVPSSLDASSGRHDAVIEALDAKTLQFGRFQVDLQGVDQLAEQDQTGTIGLIIEYAKNRYLAEGRPIREILDLVDRDLSTEGLECLSRELEGRLARPRRYEIAAALNRIPSLRISHVAE